jgi:hypothetical protein
MTGAVAVAGAGRTPRVSKMAATVRAIGNKRHTSPG